MELFDRGAARFRESRFADAIELFEQAYALDANPVLLYNIGRAYEGLKDPRRAREAYERYLEAAPEAPDRAVVGEAIAELKRQEAAANAPPPASTPTSTPPAGPPESAGVPEPRAITLPLTLLAVGVAGIGVGAGFGVVALGNESDAEAAPDAFEAAELRDEGARNATISSVAFIVGGLLTAVGATWTLIEIGGDGPQPKSISVELQGTWLGGSF